MDKEACCSEDDSSLGSKSRFTSFGKILEHTGLLVGTSKRLVLILFKVEVGVAVISGEMLDITNYKKKRNY